MTKVTYTPVADHGDKGETRQAGYKFEKGQSVEVNDERQLEKMRANPNFKVAGGKAEAEPKKDDRNLEPDPSIPPPTIANMVYPSQPPGVGMKTVAIPRPEGSVEAALESHGGDIKAAAEAAQTQAETLQGSADRLADAQKASEKADKSAGKGASKSAKKSAKTASKGAKKSAKSKR